MRPLTVRRLLWTCGLLAVVLLACVVLALKLGRRADFPSQTWSGTSAAWPWGAAINFRPNTA